MVLKEGLIVEFGARDEVLGKFTRPAAAPAQIAQHAAKAAIAGPSAV